MTSNYTVYHGDCLEVLPTLAADSVDTIITDPPYGLEFMGKDWDHGVPGEHFWREALRVAKPGAMLLAFGGTRTHHRLMVAIEDAGWELRDVIMWVYGSGFPKSHNISKAIDKAAGAEREVVGERIRLGDKKAYAHNATSQIYGTDNDHLRNGMRPPETAPATSAAQLWNGYGTALKPAWEPIIVAMKPTDGTFANNALTHGVAGLWVDGGRVEAPEGRITYKADGVTAGRERTSNLVDTGNGRTPDGRNLEKIIQRHAQYAKNRQETTVTGRFPANLIHDGSDEVTKLFPASNGGAFPGHRNTSGYGGGLDQGATPHGFYKMGDTGSAARFFYCAKASRSERNAGLEGMETVGTPQRYGLGDLGNGKTTKHKNAPRQNHHPTVKPIALARYLARLTKTPTGGVMLDMFAGSGSLGCGGLLEGRDVIVIEKEAAYIPIIEARLKHWQTVARQAAGEVVMTDKEQASGQLPLFEGMA